MKALPTQPEKIHIVFANGIKTWWSDIIPTFPLSLAFGILVALESYFLARPAPYSLTSQAPWQMLLLYIVLGLGLFVLYIAFYHYIQHRLNLQVESDINALKAGVKKLFYVLMALFIYFCTMTIIMLFISTPFFLIIHHLTMTADPHQFILSMYVRIPFLVLIDMLIIAIPYVYFAIMLLFYIPLIIVDHLDPVAAFKRSCSLVWGNWWRTLVVSGTIFFILPFLLIMLDWVVSYQFATAYLTLKQTWLLHSILQGIIAVFYMPFCVTIMLVQLHDLKIRKSLKMAAQEKATAH